MAHYAVLNEKNIVTQVFVGRDEDDLPDGIDDWETYYAPEGHTVKRTSYNTHRGEHVLGGTPFRGNYAGVGYSYDETLDVFLPPKPHGSWTLNEACYCWEAPVVMPDDGGRYVWVEELGDWVAVPEPTE